MGTGHSPLGPQLTSVVLFVRDLDESVRFYRALLNVDVRVQTDTACLLARADGLQLYLRATGRHGSHSAGDVGLQYVIWTATDIDDLSRCEHLLKTGATHTSTWQVDGFTVVEGADPSGTPILLSYPGPESAPRHEIMNRIYSW